MFGTSGLCQFNRTCDYMKGGFDQRAFIRACGPYRGQSIFPAMSIMQDYEGQEADVAAGERKAYYNKEV